MNKVAVNRRDSFELEFEWGSKLKLRGRMGYLFIVTTKSIAIHNERHTRKFK